ncbi:MAG TPA: SCO family protein [Marinagarivorans sp.]
MRIRVVLIIITLWVTGLSGNGAYASDDRFDILKGPKPLPEFSLLDQNGAEFTQDQVKNKWSLMFLGFTSCPDICPVTLMKLTALRKQLRSCVAVPLVPEIVLLAVDPERDQESLKKGYLDSFDADNTGITGDWEEIDTLVDGLGGAYKFGKKHSGAHAGHHGHHGYEVVHTTAVYVIDPNGAVVATMGMPLDVSSASLFLAKLMTGDTRENTAELSACLAKPAKVAGTNE